METSGHKQRGTSKEAYQTTPPSFFNDDSLKSVEPTLIVALGGDHPHNPSRWVNDLPEVHIHNGLLYSNPAQPVQDHPPSCAATRRSRALSTPIVCDALKKALQFLNQSELVTAVQAFDSGQILNRTTTDDPKATLETTLQCCHSTFRFLSGLPRVQARSEQAIWPDLMARELREKNSESMRLFWVKDHGARI